MGEERQPVGRPEPPQVLLNLSGVRVAREAQTARHAPAVGVHNHTLGAEALAHHERMTELKMRLLGDRVSRRTAWKIAREHGWDTTYDAEYLAVCRLQADALVTVDEAFAARAGGIVPIEPLAALSSPG